MSNALALAHVTQALALLIESNVGPEFGEAVKVEPRKPHADPPAEPTISVFLYQVTPNTSQRNNDLPTRAADGTLVKRPAAALDLHFLISAYGDETELVGQRLIGSVVRTLHEIPVLPKDVIERAGEKPYLAGSDLAEAAQRVRFVPTVMDIDETSKLWGMLYQTPYSLSVVYQAALVLIDGQQTPVPGKPVERTTVRVLPFGAPGAPVPPGAERDADVPSHAGASADVVKAGAGERGRASAGAEGRAPAKAGASLPAKAAAKTPGRPRKAVQPARTAKSAVVKKPSKRAEPAERERTDGGTGPRPAGGEGTES
ncbi:DUF4255 domain-containing protein [Streptomyces sp. HUCO-GS316]|uniref:DUF4255 domain-containing protein n=1 Tax=Streptomyces sp. HUCO-GS316 TaxID=2692198 RepID=UPI00136F4240|nr:DUF4255 domain-containing protein [Streptomyces sp. HUCO-GS316]MXM63585.1 DUF4255 domain-containing protein [Streptomyces sp. HUCO-GS316]